MAHALDAARALVGWNGNRSGSTAPLRHSAIALGVRPARRISDGIKHTRAASASRGHLWTRAAGWPVEPPSSSAPSTPCLEAWRRRRRRRRRAVLVCVFLLQAHLLMHLVSRVAPVAPAPPRAAPALVRATAATIAALALALARRASIARATAALARDLRAATRLGRTTAQRADRPRDRGADGGGRYTPAAAAAPLGRRLVFGHPVGVPSRLVVEAPPQRVRPVLLPTRRSVAITNRARPRTRAARDPLLIDVSCLRPLRGWRRRGSSLAAAARPPPP